MFDFRVRLLKVADFLRQDQKEPQNFQNNFNKNNIIIINNNNNNNSNNNNYSNINNNNNNNNNYYNNNKNEVDIELEKGKN